jgi:EpsD family peptidyl-prolyl cis-trans isomerase
MKKAEPSVASFLRPAACALGALALALTLAACGGRDDAGASQAAARVNKEEITVHQINYVLQQQRGLKPEQVDQASRQILERLIDQQLALQKADDQKLDRDPRVIQQIEAAKREIIARAYVDKVGEAATKPTPEEIKKYYDEKPALFKERRIYNFQEIAIESKPDQVQGLREQLGAVKNIGEFIEYLKAHDFHFAANQAVRAAEQLPLQNLDAFARMKDGQAVLVPAANGVQVIVLAGSRNQPIAEEQARPVIEQYLLNERKRKLVEEDIKALRGSAKIEYIGKFVPGAASPAASAAAVAPSPASAPAPAPAPAASDAALPAAAASGALSTDDISKGLGLKK